MSADENIVRLKKLLAGGSKKAPELQKALGVSQPTLSRLIRNAGPDILSFGATRSTFYALANPVASVGSEIPVFSVDNKGRVQHYGILYCLAAQQYYWQPESMPGTLYKHLPWFVESVRPEGFLGRAFAHVHHDQGFPERLFDWNDKHLLAALVLYGSDLPGNLIFGKKSLATYLAVSRSGQGKIAAQDRERAYPRMAFDAMAGNPPGSSAGGEQPKFTTVVIDGSGCRHVLVKFSPPATTPEGQRWSDLMVCEHLALQTLQEAGRCAAISDVFFFEQRCFLEVQRFDRVAEFGRLAVATLGVVEDEFFGERDRWEDATQRLEQQNMLDSKSACAIRFQSAFGKMIANTDQHFGNISLFIKDKGRFEVAPAYDVLPMFYRPTATAEIVERHYELSAPTAGLAEEWDRAQEFAIAFWKKVECDHRVSKEFRSIAQCHVNDLTQDQGPGLVR